MPFTLGARLGAYELVARIGAGVIGLLSLSACGGQEGPLAPSPPAPPNQPPPLIVTVIDMLAGNPVTTARVSLLAGRLTVQAEGYLTHETNAKPLVQLIPLRAPFDLDYYRKIARNGYEQPDNLRPLRRWASPPDVYLETDPTNLALIGHMQAWLTEGLRQWRGWEPASFTVGLTPPDRGMIVRFSAEPNPGRCALATGIGTNPSYITFYVFAPGNTCAKGIDGFLNREVIIHEIGHSLGLWHTGVTGDLMADSLYRAGASIQPRERLHIDVLYNRAAGNVDPDLDPPSAALRSASVVID